MGVYTDYKPTGLILDYERSYDQWDTYQATCISWDVIVLFRSISSSVYGIQLVVLSLKSSTVSREPRSRDVSEFLKSGGFLNQTCWFGTHCFSWGVPGCSFPEATLVESNPGPTSFS